MRAFVFCFLITWAGSLYGQTINPSSSPLSSDEIWDSLKNMNDNHKIFPKQHSINLRKYKKMQSRSYIPDYISERLKTTIHNYYFRGGSLHKVIKEIDELEYSYITLREVKRIEYLNDIQAKINKCYLGTTGKVDKYKIQKVINLLLNTKSMSLEHSISIRNLIHKIDDETLIDIEVELREINKIIAKTEMKLLQEDTSNINRLIIHINKLYEDRDIIVNKILRDKNLKESMKRKPLKWQEIQKKLKRNEIIIDIVRVDTSSQITPVYGYHVSIIKKGIHPLFIPLTDEKIISGLLHADSNGQPEYMQHMLLRKELYKSIWQPLLPYLDGIKTVHISPAGLLHRVSFEALQDEKRQYLGEQFQFHYYSSIRDFIKEKPLQQSYEDVILMGDILYDLEDTLQYQTEEWYTMRNGGRGKVRRLEATLKEVIDIHKICDSMGIKNTMLTFNKATEDTIQHFSGERAPSILHLATHGMFLEPIDVPKTGGTTEERLRSFTNPLQRSVLMLYGANHRWEKNEPTIGTDEDGIFTALEVTALDLRKTDLVVLSACSTALGEVQHNTEGVFGLQRAFKLAGVDYVVASLWDVDDGATKDLMVEFYKNLLERKQDPATALRNAKNHFREKWDPELWAGFILIE